jgi:hypothetical protein
LCAHSSFLLLSLSSLSLLSPEKKKLILLFTRVCLSVFYHSIFFLLRVDQHVYSAGVPDGVKWSQQIFLTNTICSVRSSILCNTRDSQSHFFSSLFP